MSYASDGCSYRWHCYTCHTTRDYGAARLRMEVEAGKHARRFDSHRIALQELRTYAAFGARDNQPSLPVDVGGGSSDDTSDEPPF